MLRIEETLKETLAVTSVNELHSANFSPFSTKAKITSSPTMRNCFLAPLFCFTTNLAPALHFYFPQLCSSPCFISPLWMMMLEILMN